MKPCSRDGAWRAVDLGAAAKAAQKPSGSGVPSKGLYGVFMKLYRGYVGLHWGYRGYIGLYRVI